MVRVYRPASLLPDKCFTIPALPAGCLDVPDGEGVQACLLPVQPLPQHQHADILFVPLYVKYARVVAVWTDRVKINIVEQKLGDNFNITGESLIKVIRICKKLTANNSLVLIMERMERINYF
jgi:hypothetical protein